VLIGSRPEDNKINMNLCLKEMYATAQETKSNSATQNVVGQEFIER
jgi:hypothetical protein